MLPPETNLQSVERVIQNQEMWKNIGLKPGLARLNAQLGFVAYNIVPTLRAPKAPEIEDVFRKFTTALKQVVPAYPQKCEKCEKDVTRPVLVNGAPAYLCDDDVDKLKAEFQKVESTYREAKPNYARALGLLAALGGAAIWAIVGLVTGYIFMLVGFVIGFLVSYAISWGAEKVTPPMIVVMVVLSILSTFLGEWLWFILMANQFGFGFDPMLALRAYLHYAGDNAGSATLSYFFTIVPAIYMAWKLFGRARAIRPHLDIQY